MGMWHGHEWHEHKFVLMMALVLLLVGFDDCTCIVADFVYWVKSVTHSADGDGYEHGNEHGLEHGFEHGLGFEHGPGLERENTYERGHGHGIEHEHG